MIKITKLIALLLIPVLILGCKKKEDEEQVPSLGISDSEIQKRLKVSLKGQFPDSDAATRKRICSGNAGMQLMSDDPDCGYVDIGEHCVNVINQYRAKKGLSPFVRAHEKELCAAREARKALEAKKAHFSDGCGWKSQGAAGGGRQNGGTVEKSVNWVPRLFYEEGPSGGHYQAMMTKRSRYVACGFYAKDRNTHHVIVNYYDSLD